MYKFLLAVLLASPLAAQPKSEFWPGATYDARVPTCEKVLGYAPGDRITAHAGIIKYLEALASSTGRVKIFEYAQSWEGRKLVYAVIGSEANLKRLDAIRTSMHNLADPRRTPASETASIISKLPAPVWLAYGVHGNEISSPEAALLTAYHLLASRGDKMVDEILAQTLVFIDPLQNPDGRDRFVNHFYQELGLEPDASPNAAEHNEQWPSGRTNHYGFDLNRDWFAMTQPETRGRIKILQEWFPVVFVDLHEMGADSTYYFAPKADPYNPHMTRFQRESLDLFGKNDARWFDKFGFDYFTREVYDGFYPGYGDGWPSFHGSVAMTYEQASARGLVMRRSNEQILSYRETIRRHFVGSISTLETSARNREKLLNEFYRFRQTAIEEGSKESTREFLLPRRGDTAAVDKLAGLLKSQGVEVHQAGAAFKACGADYAAGTYVIPMAQPAKRLARVLLDPQVSMDEAFLKEQERRRKQKLPDEIYDVTAWSLPLSYNVSAVPCSEEWRQAAGRPAQPDQSLSPSAIAYLVPWGTQSSGGFLAAALRQGLRILSTDKTFTQNGANYPSGTLILTAHDNAPKLAETIQKIAASTGAQVRATDTGWVEEGVNFGSRHVVTMRKPAIALAWDTPTSSSAAGNTRFVLERQYGYPVTTIRCQSLGGADLNRFQVLILPDGGGREGGYAQAFSANTVKRLKDWAAAGGTLIAVGGAVDFLADPKTGLLAVSQENAARAAESKEKDAKPPAEAKPPEGKVPGKLLATEADYRKAIQADTELPDRLTGTLVRARVDRDHWITAGAPEMVYALVEGRSVFTPIKLDKGTNAAVFMGPDQLLASGYMWEENRKQMAYKPFVIVQPEGRGFIVAFTADPCFRGYMDGLNILFLNAVFRGPAHSRQ